MKKALLLFGALFVLAVACSNREPGTKLQKDTPAYQLAKNLSAKLNYLDPDNNSILISTKTFDISAGDVCSSIQTNFGNRTNQLTGLDSTQLADFIHQTAASLAERKLLLKAATNAKTSVPQAKLDSVLNLQYTRAGGEEQFLKVLEQNQVSIEEVKDDVRDVLTVERYLDDAVFAKIDISEAEIEASYSEDKTASVRHILLGTQGKSDSEKQEIRKKLEGLLKRAQKGEDFAELAKQYTEDPGSKNNGGLYESFGRGKMVKPFEEAAFSVPVGEISDIVETNYGYHILKVVERTKETRPLEEVRPELEAQLKQQRTDVAVQEHVAELKEQAGFKVVMP